MRTALLSAGLLLAVSLVAFASPASALEADADAEASMLWGCDGVTVGGEFTGHCGSPCNGRIYLNGNRWGDHICVQFLCDLVCSPPVATGASAAPLLSTCNGITLAGEFTGHCGNTCYGTITAHGVWIADHHCNPAVRS